MRLIETSNLKTWASSKPAESRFPYIVKNLIQHTIQPEKLRMPSGDAVWVPGYDGIVVNGEENRFVPIGQSVWELGTNANPRSKANEDYEKRSISDEEQVTQQPDRSQITFVFVTPRVWGDKDAWIAERMAEGVWREIKVIDGVDLQDWLEITPAVNLQFAAELGLAPEVGLYTPEQAWEDWSHRTSPPTSEELVVAGRNEEANELISRLLAPPNTFVVRGDSPGEAWGFALAVVRQFESDQLGKNLCARTIIADNENVANSLQYRRNLIIILKQTQGQVSGLLSSHDCHVIVPEGNDAHSQRNVIVLTRPSHRIFTEALVRMNLPEDDAERIARSCGLRVTILQRQLAHANFEPPQWARGPSVTNLLPVLLAGRWDGKSKFDREVLCYLAGNPEYSHVTNQLQEFLLVDEPPIQRLGDMWTLTAPVDAFTLIARRLTATNLERFKSAFREVFGRFDPKLEIPLDEWVFYDIKGEKGHSAWLRSSMAETLVLIATFGSNSGLYCDPSPQAYVDDVVKGLPGLNDDWRLLASLRDQYPRLMEAAPGPFLDSLERLIEAKPEDIRRLFAEGHGIFGGSAIHTGLLWALETLAWSPEYLPRVALILAKLASLDPGVKIHNRPINSLRELFLWWHPGTNASLEQRVAAINLILAREQDIGWSLLESLIDTRNTISNPTSKPRWRDFGDPPEDFFTKRGRTQYLSAIIDRALDRLGSNPERWHTVLNSLHILSPSHQQRAMGLLDAVSKEPVSEDVRLAFWEMLRDFIYQQRTYKDATWTLQPDLIEMLDTIMQRFVPGDPSERNRWLFEDWLPDLPSGQDDIKQREREIEVLREQAVRDILQEQGEEGLVNFGVTCKYPGFVASLAVSIIKNAEELYHLIELAISAGENGIILAGQISGFAMQTLGNDWREFLLERIRVSTWTPAVIASLLIWWPDERPTWQDAIDLGEEVTEEYWRRKHIRLIDGSLQDQTYQINQFIKVGRAANVFERISFQMEALQTEELLRLFDATLSELSQAKTLEDIKRFRVSSYNMREFLLGLRKRTDVTREDLARREYQALPLLGLLDAHGLTIHEFMAEDPNFFIEIICNVFLPAHRDKTENTEFTPEIKAKAEAGYRLLEGMDKIPGHFSDNKIDEEVLLRWVNAVRSKAIEVDRAAIADQKIGDILAHSPVDSEDGGWPHRVIRNVIEKVSSDNIDLGIRVKRYNMRGTFSKELYEGGAQERAIASQYHGWAEISRTQWPRTAHLLETIAQEWEYEAHRADEHAEQDKLE